MESVLTGVTRRRGDGESIAVAIHRKAAAAGGESQHGIMDTLLMGVLNEIDYGLMLVTETGRVRFANHAALHECGVGFAMRLHDGLVVPRLEREHEGYFKALTLSRLGRRSMLNLHCEQSTISLAVVPVSGPSGAGGESAVLLVFGKRQVCEPLSVEFFARTHHLTVAETTVLKGLCAGLRPVQIADLAGVAISTVRTQIGNIRIKTEAPSIAELVRRVTVLPPIVSALNKLNWPVDGHMQPAHA